MEEAPKIVVEPPGPKARELLERDQRVISPSYVRFYPLVVDRAKGALIYDVDGNVYIDLNSGLAVMSVGHGHPEVLRAIKEQADRLLHYSNTDFYYEPSVRLAEKLVQITPGNFGKRVYFGNSGTEAVEAAMKMARWHTKRQYFIGFIGAFHGRTLGSLSLTSSKPVQRGRFSPLIPGVVHVPYPYCYRCPFRQQFPDCGLYCVDFIEEWVLKKYVPPDEVAAFVIEPIQGEGGYVPPPEGYFERLRKLADEHDILLILDEVQSGTGRTGKWWAIEHWGVVPDAITSAKALGGGLPLGALIAREDLMDWVGGSHASTFGGNPVSCAASLATISVIERENLLERVARLGEEVKKRFRDAMSEHPLIGDVRGKGFMVGVELVKDRETKEPAKKEAAEVMMRAWKSGVAVITAGVSTIRIAPPLNIPEDLLWRAIDIILDKMGEVEREKGLS